MAYAVQQVRRADRCAADSHGYRNVARARLRKIRFAARAGNQKVAGLPLVERHGRAHRHGFDFVLAVPKRVSLVCDEAFGGRRRLWRPHDCARRYLWRRHVRKFVRAPWESVMA